MVSNEHSSVKAAAAVVADTRVVSARSMCANGRARASELELWMVCSGMPAVLACSTRAAGNEGTQISMTATAFYSKPSRKKTLTMLVFLTEGAETRH